MSIINPWDLRQYAEDQVFGNPDPTLAELKSLLNLTLEQPESPEKCYVLQKIMGNDFIAHLFSHDAETWINRRNMVDKSYIKGSKPTLGKIV